MPRLMLLFVSLVAVAACKEVNSEYCSSGLHPDDPVCADAGGSACTSKTDCKEPGFPFCNTSAPGGGVCVECLQNAECPAAEPVCSNNACGVCTRHTDCGSSVCLPDGTCAQETDVAYVDGAGTVGSECTKAQPCKRLEEAVDKGRSVVKVSGTLLDRTTLDGKNATILADPGAKLQPSTSGIALDIKAGAVVKVYDLEITRAAGSQPGLALSGSANVEMTRVTLSENSADGVRVSGGHLTCTLCTIQRNADLGLNVTDGVLTLVRSTIRDNVKGGVAVGPKGDFQIVGNVIFNNGNSGAVGGISITVDGSANNRIEFNSISRNKTGATAAGIHCTSAMTMLTASHNVIWQNAGTGGQVGGIGCNHQSSDIGPTPPGGAINVDPQFVNGDTGDLHLSSTSPVRRKADAGADLTGLAAQDIDGQTRVAPADLGADQTP